MDRIFGGATYGQVGYPRWPPLLLHRRLLQDHVRKKLLPFAVGVLIVASLTACSDQTPADPGGRLDSQQIKALSKEEADAGHDEQAALLKDGEVTTSELDQAFQLVRKCYESHGYTVNGPTINPIDGFSYSFSVNAEGYEENSVWENLEACETEYWRSAMRAYGSVHEAVMDPALLVATSECLTRKNQTVAESARNLKDVVGSNGVDQEDALNCVSDAAVRLYPDLPAINLNF